MGSSVGWATGPRFAMPHRARPCRAVWVGPYYAMPHRAMPRRASRTTSCLRLPIRYPHLLPLSQDWEWMLDYKDERVPYDLKITDEHGMTLLHRAILHGSKAKEVVQKVRWA